MLIGDDEGTGDGFAVERVGEGTAEGDLQEVGGGEFILEEGTDPGGSEFQEGHARGLSRG